MPSNAVSPNGPGTLSRSFSAFTSASAKPLRKARTTRRTTASETAANPRVSRSSTVTLCSGEARHGNCIAGPMRVLYILSSYLLLLLLFPVLLLHRKTRDGVLQRLGFYRSGELPDGA